MSGTVITNKGLALIAKLVASGTTLTFTRAAVGTGSVPSGYDPGGMAALNNYAMDGAISSCSASGDEASIVFQISSIGVSTGFTATEAGLFATDPDDGEILYAYLDMSTDPQYIYPENAAISKFVEVTLVVKVGTVESVTAYINPSSLVTREDFDEKIEELEYPEFEDYSDESVTVPSAAAALAALKSKIKLPIWMSNVVAFCKGCVTRSMIVNNCVTDRTDLPGSAAQLKVLMDLYNVLSTKIGNLEVKSFTITNESYLSSVIFLYKTGRVVFASYASNIKNIVIGSNILANIPNEYRPVYDVIINPYASFESQIHYHLNGDVELYNYSASDQPDVQYCRFSASWISKV